MHVHLLWQVSQNPGARRQDVESGAKAEHSSYHWKVLAAREQEAGGKDLGGHTGQRRCEVTTTPRQAS